MHNSMKKKFKNFFGGILEFCPCVHYFVQLIVQEKKTKIYFVNEMGWFCNDSAILENQAKKTSGLGFGLSQPVTEILDHFFCRKEPSCTNYCPNFPQK